jgi:phage shock protein A
MRRGDDVRRSRSSDEKLLALRVENEKMVTKLGYANATIERLNQLIQRHEAHITRLREQRAESKQQIQRQESHIAGLREQLSTLKQQLLRRQQSPSQTRQRSQRG